MEKGKRETCMISLMKSWEFGGEMENWRREKAESLKSREIRKGQWEGEMKERKWMIYDRVASLDSPWTLLESPWIPLPETPRASSCSSERWHGFYNGGRADRRNNLPWLLSEVGPTHMDASAVECGRLLLGFLEV